MTKRTTGCLLLGTVVAVALAGRVDVDSAQAPTEVAALAEEVRQTERAFARTMATRDHAAFVSFLAEDTVFLSEIRTLRGRTQVADAWKRYYEGEKAPFSWDPERVEVLDSGTLALSTGPVFDPSGARVGTFNSVWRREGPGRWRIVFDTGCPPCRCETAGK